jgi:hypothetical protein
MPPTVPTHRPSHRLTLRRLRRSFSATAAQRRAYAVTCKALAGEYLGPTLYLTPPLFAERDAVAGLLSQGAFYFILDTRPAGRLFGQQGSEVGQRQNVDCAVGAG